MKFVLLTNVVSPHKIPLAKEIARLVGEDDFAYIAIRGLTDERRRLGWNESETFPWLKNKSDVNLAENAQTLLTDVRDFNLFKRRAAKGLKTIYESERWFKPIKMMGVYLPGWIRLLAPRYFKMAKDLTLLLGNVSDFFYFPIGVWAMNDARLMCQLFRVPPRKADAQIGLWGYFVEPSRHLAKCPDHVALKVFWAGRMMKLKRVDTIIDAVASLVLQGYDITLDIIGSGECEEYLKTCATKCPPGHISFAGSEPYDKMRKLMRQYDVYVLSSNAEEGWGAIVGEAMSEGVAVVGSLEAGAPKSIIRNGENGFTFHAGDVKGLAEALKRLCDKNLRHTIAQNGLKTIMEKWSPEVAARNLFNRVNRHE